MPYTIKLRRGPAAEWTVDNPILSQGEVGYEIDTGKFKIGDGLQSWTDLPYFINQPAIQALIEAVVEDAVLEGVEGDSAYEVAVNNGFVGTEVQWLASLVGPQGPEGPQGDTGPTGIQGPPGSTGDPGEQGPAGETGPEGASAYEVAVANGFVGNEAAWLASLVGPEGEQGPQGIQGVPGDDGAQGPEGDQGPQGVPGISAYQVAVNNGFVGNEAAWLASLEGPEGPEGPQGIQGEEGPQGPAGEDGTDGTNPVGAMIAYYWDGDSYEIATGAGHYVGPTDPGSVPNGSVWDDTA